MIDESFLDQLSKFNLLVNKRVTSNYVGMRKSIAAGHGLIFEDHQQYAYGDDFRKIDWRVYARSDELFIRRFEEERSTTVRIMLDSSASMQFRKKWDYASMLAVGFAYLTMRENEKFQLLTFDKDINFFRAKRGRAHLSEMVRILNSMKNTKAGAFLKNVKILKKQISSKSTLILISDFLYDKEEIESSLALLKKNDLHLIQVMDEQELDFDFDGEYNFKDSESDSLMRTFVSPSMRNFYQRGLHEHVALVENLAKVIGARHTLISTKDTVFDAFYKTLS